MTGTTPDWIIGNTTIKWTRVIKNGDRPSLEIINNLYQVCGIAQEIVGKGCKNKCFFGYRNARNNAAVVLQQVYI